MADTDSNPTVAELVAEAEPAPPPEVPTIPLAPSEPTHTAQTPQSDGYAFGTPEISEVKGLASKLEEIARAARGKLRDLAEKLEQRRVDESRKPASLSHERRSPPSAHSS